MDTVTSQRIEVHRQRGGKGLALTRTHFGNLALVQGHAAQHLHVKVAHFHDTLGPLAHHGKGLRQQIVHSLSVSQALFKALGAGAQFVIREGLIASL